MKNRLLHAVVRCVAAALVAATVPSFSFAAEESSAPSAAPNEASLAREPGVAVRVYEVSERLTELPLLIPNQTANSNVKRDNVDFKKAGDFGSGPVDGFLTEVSGFINVKEAGEYAFRLNSDDGSTLAINGKLVVSNDGLHDERPPKDGKVKLAPGEHPFVVRHFDASGGEVLTLSWQPPGAKAFAVVPPDVFTCPANEVRVTSPGAKKVYARQGPDQRPGDGRPLAAVHPSLALSQARPEGFEPKVGGIDFLPDGRMIICTWDPTGGVYILGNVAQPDPSQITVTRFAAGLAEPLGIKVVDGRIFVLQKQELTELIDHDQDGVADEYRAVAADWNVTANFHEFAFGLAYKEGFFYANLAVAINPGGATTPNQAKGRGTTIKIGLDGSVQTFATGLRTPNGIGLGPDDAIFVADNQGDWLPSSKLVHVQEGHFYNSHINPDHDNAHLPPTPPIAWLPQNEIGNSPSEPVLVKRGPYAGQVLLGDVTHGGLNRIFIEKVDGQWQGAALQFTQGLEGGVNRLHEGPDGALYVGQIGSGGNWGQSGKKSFGLQRLAWNERTTFEPLAVRAKTNGVEIELTEPLADRQVLDPEAFTVQQFRYEPKKEYGGPKVDLQTISLPSVGLSADRKKLFLPIEGMKAGHVIYVRLDPELTSASNQKLWVTEAWYTMNAIPKDSALPVPPPMPVNVLTEAEQAEGWRLLFDGKTTAGWRGYGKKEMGKSFAVEEGSLVRVAGGGDIITDEQFTDFELSIDWKISEGGNSGVFYRVNESLSVGYLSGPEMQVLDNARHQDGGNPLTSAGSAYAVLAPAKNVALPANKWNKARLLVRGNHVEHWLNGVKIVEYELNSDAWNAAVAQSKFKNEKRYGREPTGHLVLQDHGDRVAYRNIKIRELK
jgi:cytochrome c